VGRRNPLRLGIASLDVRDGRLVLRGADLHHLRVRRLKPGDPIVCFDGSGTEYAGRIRSLESSMAEVEIASAARPRRESPLRLTLAQAVLKGDHLDLVVEKATELGVRELLLFACERTVADPSPARLERLERIAESAAKQSGRVQVPSLTHLPGFDAVLEPSALLFHPEAAQRLAPDLCDGEHLRLIVGPEGGFSEAEVERAAAAGCTIVGLGPRVLRAETAGIAVCAIAQLFWGDLAS
jgi:16S rRNA (uracil1498-N3)-methyltransferase